MDEKKLNVAIVGCGYWGPNLIRNFSQLPEANLSKICDLDKNKLEEIKKQYPTIETTDSYDELLNDNKINAIIIATPVFTHFELAKKALENDKHVFIEKPETLTSKEAEELLEISNQKNKIIMVDHIFEYSPAINKIKQILDNKELGNPNYIHAEWLSLGRLQPEVNVIWDLAVHVFAALNYILGKKPISLSAHTKAYFREDIDEVAVITLNFPDKIKAFVTVSWTEPEKTRKMTIVGSKKMLVYNMLDKDQIKIHNKSVNINQNQITYPEGEITPIKIEDTEPLKTSCSHFISCIKNNTVPRSDGQDGLDIVRILEATDESIKNNGKEIIL
ncbi:MAG: Gfo/Idh/MocA family oxidoreductase [Nanoarchaeota archaeon]|nr:Gfo/Idh/MocA family oxidoreductase [Nanoarchaeota archaeon]